jgi:very-short-patch-repair endonuclease
VPADVYIPALDMIIQVDGQHHNQQVQLAKDARFDATAFEQRRALLRLHHEDMMSFHEIIPDAVMRCIQRCQLSLQRGSALTSLIMYSSTHQQQSRPRDSVTIEK